VGAFSGLEHIVRQSEPLAPYTWFRLGGAAEHFAEPTNVEELVGLLRRCHAEQIPIRLLGGGSNVLVPSGGVSGLVIHLSAPAFCGISVEDRTITAGGGAKLAHVVSTSVREGLAGLDSLVGIPGTVGGALHGNAAGHGSDIGQWTCGATVVTRAGETITRRREELHFAYHHSSLDEIVILDAKFELEREDAAELTRRMQKLWIVKRAQQPSSEHGAGRIFIDPPGLSAADLIDQAGLKGARVGAAEISDRNSNFVVAGPGTTSEHVLNLINDVRSRVAEQLGVEMETEIQIW
jgi:UDP-N-acetylmuramate dehydrogenase